MKKPNVKAMLVLRGLKQADLAGRINVTQQFFSQVVNRKRTSARVQLFIADVLQMKPELLWPRDGHGRRAA
ncbi:MAG: helix-turn-helix transcriptional regulator [Actinomycetota bacterium]|nr:helix-turn-helix transcriptional regulator [Actinomycetota bacterium]